MSERLAATKEKRRVLAAWRSHLGGRILKLDDEIRCLERATRGQCSACKGAGVVPHKWQEYATMPCGECEGRGWQTKGEDA